MHPKPQSLLIAPDKFKGSLRASEVARAIGEGILSAQPNMRICYQPMADGGDGSIELLHECWGLEEYQLEVSDPLFRPITASYYGSGEAAFIEMARASGLALLAPHERNCLKTTSLGTGQLMLHAFRQGFRQLNLFIGGSATNDAGMGIASALGYTFLDARGQPLPPTGEQLGRVHHIQASELARSLQQCKIQVVCDVNNPFYGPQGAAYVYAPQKGADQAAVALLDAGLRHLDAIFWQQGYGRVQALPGAGAAGGVGGGMAALFGATLKPGIDLFIELFELEEKVQQADAVITGEGRLDEQSFQGKVAGGILRLCQQHQKPLYLICGQQQLGPRPGAPPLPFRLSTLLDFAPSAEAAMTDAARYLRQAGAALARSWEEG